MDHCRSLEKRSYENHYGRSRRNLEQQTLQRTEKDGSLHRKRPLHQIMHPAQGPLNADDDYVKKWLAQTDIEEKSSKEHINSMKNFQDQVSYDNLEYHDRSLQSFRKSKRRHNSSSDSSLIQQPTTLKSILPPHEYSRSIEEIQEVISPPKKKQRMSPNRETRSPDSQLSVVLKETYEKRVRHKTREDRYDTMKKEKKLKKGEDKKSATKREKKGDRRKNAKKSGEALMRNFSSRNIGQDRLTIKPSSGLGLFKNGRASSPAKRRGIPDLAFSEMDFLQHPKRHPPEIKEDKIRFKSRQKERRQVARRHDEISAFFKPGRTPMREIDNNRKNKVGQSKLKEDTQMYTDNDQSSPRANRRFQSTISPQEYYLMNEEPRKTSPHQHSPFISHPRNINGSTSNISGKANSYVSWSETQFSPTGRSRLVGRQRNSSTPASIRKSIQDTRIFRDTGIVLKPNSGRLDVTTSRPPATHRKRPSSRQVTINEASLEKRSSSSHETMTSAVGFKRPELESHFNLQEGAENELQSDSTESSTSSQFTDSPNRETVTYGNVTLQHFDPKLEWLERSNSAPNANAEVSQETDKTPFIREEIARGARIKRPATTLPVLRDNFKDQQRSKTTGKVETLAHTEPTLATSEEHLRSYEDMKSCNITDHQPLLNQQDTFSSQAQHNFARRQSEQPSAKDLIGEARSILAQHNDEIAIPFIWNSINSGTGGNLGSSRIRSPFQTGQSALSFGFPIRRHQLGPFSSSNPPLATIPEEEPLFLGQVQVSHSVGQYPLREENRMCNDLQVLENSLPMSYLDDSCGEDNILHLNNEFVVDETNMGLLGYSEADDLGLDYDEEITISHLVSHPNELEYDFLDDQQASYEPYQERDNFYQEEDLPNSFALEEQEPVYQQYDPEELGQIETFWRSYPQY